MVVPHGLQHELETWITIVSTCNVLVVLASFLILVDLVTIKNIEKHPDNVSDRPLPIMMTFWTYMNHANTSRPRIVVWDL